MPRGNPLDINQPSGFVRLSCMVMVAFADMHVSKCECMYGSFSPQMSADVRLAVLTILAATPDAIVHFGLVCSSWIGICRGSSGRTYLSPLGFQHLEFVESGNVMMSRPLWLQYVCMCMRGCIIMYSVFMSALSAAMAPHGWPLGQDCPAHLSVPGSRIVLDSGAALNITSL